MVDNLFKKYFLFLTELIPKPHHAFPKQSTEHCTDITI